MRNALSSHSSQRKTSRAIGISPRLFYSVTTLLLAVNAGLVLLLGMHDDITRLFAPPSTTAISLYETRIADLRTEIDRLNSRQYVRQGDINLQLRDLAQQQEDLAEQQQIVRALNRMAEDLGLTADTPAPLPAASRAVVLAGQNQIGDTASLSLTDIGASLNAMRDENRLAMENLADRARTVSDRINTTLDTIGISATPAMGGPFEPATAVSSTPLTEAANSVAVQLRRFAAARDAATDAPVHRPLTGALRVSSPFGNRQDPFENVTAFHSGIDFAAPTGTGVLSTGAGRVTFAGQKSGYGNLVEIDHGDGIISRYGHLSSILVGEGEEVTTGERIGKVGSTGRSTGPHLHFEIRRAGTPINPDAFLKAGRVLQTIL